MGITYFNQDKLERAKASLPKDAPEEAVLAAYVKLAGRYEGELEGDGAENMLEGEGVGGGKEKKVKKTKTKK